MITKKDNYNNIPTKYCTKCLDLKIGILHNTVIEYCMKCGSVEIEDIHIEEWKIKYKELYGKEFITRNK